MKSIQNELLFILEGWRVLHEFAMVNGAHVDYDDDSTQLDGELYEQLLHPLPVLLGVETMAFDYDTFQIQNAMQTNLLRLIQSHCPKVLAEVNFDSKEHYGLLIERIRKAENENKTASLNPKNPASIAQRGLSIIKQAKPLISSLADVARGIALIGWASRNVQARRECAFCPSQTDMETGGKYCHEHAQGDTNDIDRTKSKQYMKYRIGKKARELADIEGILTRPKRKSILSEPSHLRTMMNLLAPIVPTNDPENLKALHAILGKASRVVAKLGGHSIFDLEYLELIQRIKDILNPYHWRDHSMVYNIDCFEQWFYLEEHVQCGKRGPGLSASKRIDRATTLAQSGISKTEIAKALGVGQSTVSGWVKKYEVFATALEDHKPSVDLS